MEFDFDAEPENHAADTPEVETRCYAITGKPFTLDCVEAVLRCIEFLGEQEALRFVSVLVDGAGGAKVAVQILASWVAEGEAGETSEGASLRRLPDETAVQAHYVLDVAARPAR